LESWFPKIIFHRQNSFMPSYNNPLEGFHKKYIYYLLFKRNMITPEEKMRKIHAFWQILRATGFRYQLILSSFNNYERMI